MGLTQAEVASIAVVPRSTVRDWCTGKLPRSLQAQRPGTAPCHRCGGTAHAFSELPASYAYLLGIYLGDGTTSPCKRRVFKLRIFLDQRYPDIVAECAASVRAVMPDNSVSKRLTSSNCFEVYAYSKAWPCLFPQHGAGPKHKRQIELAPWQEEFATRYPHLLLRGLIQSDGCRFINTGRGNWSCPRYSFSNRSEDIHRIFCEACAQLGLRWTRAPHTVYVSRKDDVARLDAFVGPKS